MKGKCTCTHAGGRPPQAEEWIETCSHSDWHGAQNTPTKRQNMHQLGSSLPLLKVTLKCWGQTFKGRSSTLVPSAVTDIFGLLGIVSQEGRSGACLPLFHWPSVLAARLWSPGRLVPVAPHITASFTALGPYSVPATQSYFLVRKCPAAMGTLPGTSLLHCLFLKFL